MATYDLFRNKSLLNNEQFHRQDSDDSIHKICLKNGLLTAGLLIASFFGLCGITGSLKIYQLSIINMFLLAPGAYFALQSLSQDGKGGSIDYFEGFKTGMYTSLVAIAIHALFLLSYTFYFPSILNNVTNSNYYGITVSSFTVAGITFFEGLAASFIITFCLMQYFKKNEC